MIAEKNRIWEVLELFESLGPIVITTTRKRSVKILKFLNNNLIISINR